MGGDGWINDDEEEGEGVMRREVSEREGERDLPKCGDYF